MRLLLLCFLVVCTGCYEEAYVNEMGKEIPNNECGNIPHAKTFRYAAELYLPSPYKHQYWFSVGQCFVESHFREKAESHAGAQGLCQFLPTTWHEVELKLGQELDIWDAKDQILASNYYMSGLYKQWSPPQARTQEDHRRLSQASYNGGLKTVLDGQKKARGAMNWQSIEKHLPKESREYPLKIEAAVQRRCNVGG